MDKGLRTRPPLVLKGLFWYNPMVAETDSERMKQLEEKGGMDSVADRAVHEHGADGRDLSFW